MTPPSEQTDTGPQQRIRTITGNLMMDEDDEYSRLISREWMGNVRFLLTHIAALESRCATLEADRDKLLAVLKCEECDHLQHEHDGDDGPCFGGRTPDMKPGEGPYCDCDGFSSAHAASSPTTKPTDA